MDTQRIILFIVFSFSCFLLWGEWQKAHAPVPPPTQQAAPGCRPGRGTREGPSRCLPPATPPGTVPAAGAVPGQADGRAQGPDDHDPHRPVHRRSRYGGRRHFAGRAQPAPRRPRHDASRIWRCNAMPSASSVAQAGLLGEGLPNHRTLYEALPGPRELAPGADRVELKLAATARQRRQGRAGADVPSRQLCHRRGLRRHQLRHRTAVALRVFPAHARHEAAGGAELGRAGGVRRSGRLHRAGQVSEGRVRRRRQARRRSVAQAALPEDRRQRLGGDGRALLRRGVDAFRRDRRRRASSMRRSSTTGSIRPA